METLQNAKKTRSSNFELLRIISMVFIIAHHYSVHGGFQFDNSLTFNRILVQYLSLGGKLGVNCFALITGYFSCTQTKFRWRSLALFVAQVTIFSLLIEGPAMAVGYIECDSKAILKMLLPLLYNSWWFASVYFVLFLLTPFVNKLIDALTKKEHGVLLVMLFLLWSVLPTGLNVYMESNRLLWFLFLYMVAAYIRKYPEGIFSSRKISALVFGLSTLYLLATVLLFDYLGLENAAYAKQATRNGGMQMIPLVVQSLSLFCLLKNTRMKDHAWINGVSATMFGVYLLHDSDVLRKVLWRELFQNHQWQNSGFLILHALGAIAAVFVGSALLSGLYNVTLGKLAGVCFDRAKKLCKKE